MAKVEITRVVYSASANPEPESDRRYRVMVLLQRTDRPTYRKFHCPNCTYPIGELVNTEVKALSDVVDMTSLVGNGFRCDGRYDGGRCNTWYYFTLGQNK